MSAAPEDPCEALVARHLTGGGRWLAAGLRPPFAAEPWFRTAHGGRAAAPFLPPGPFDGIALRWPRGAAAGLAAARSCAARLAPGGVLAAVCPVSEGGKSLARRLGEGFGGLEERYGHHARLVLARDPLPGFAGEAAPEEVAIEGLGVFRSWPGLFAHGRLDEGTALLLRHLPPLRGARVLDFGCGAGVLSAAALRAGAARVDAVDVDALAVHAARINVPGAAVALADGIPAGLGPWDVVLSNPPLHTGNAADPQLVAHLSRARLAPGGRIVLVTQRTVPVARFFPGRAAERRHEEGGFAIWSIGA